MIHFKDKKVLVTGGSRGIGAAIVRKFAQAGADVAFNYHKAGDAARSVADDVRGLGRSAFIAPCDLADQLQVNDFFNQAADALGGLDILVNNAGIWEYGPVDELTMGDWRRTMRTNLDAVFLLTHLAVRHFKQNKAAGNIVHISSTAGQRGEANYSHYAASKGALISFTKSLGAELGPAGIRVNCVAPGWVETDMTAETMNTRNEEIRDLMPLRFIPQPDDLAGPVLFLCSDWAKAVTGEILNVNAGSVMCG